jgi:hypothetical protein
VHIPEVKQQRHSTPCLEGHLYEKREPYNYNKEQQHTGKAADQIWDLCSKSLTNEQWLHQQNVIYINVQNIFLLSQVDNDNTGTCFVGVSQTLPDRCSPVNMSPVQ